MPLPLFFVAASFALSAASTAAAGASQAISSQNASEQADFNSAQGRLQAIQADTVHRENLSIDLAQIRAARAANGLGNSPTGRKILDETRRISERERSIDVGNRRAKADEFAMMARQHRAGARMALFQTGVGLLKSGVSAFSMFGGGGGIGGGNAPQVGGSF